ncbi:6345_t:CDS:2, partial [Funneliformis geosporum]
DELKTFTCKSCKEKFQVEREYKKEKNQQDINQDLDNFNQGLNDYVENQKDNAEGNLDLSDFVNLEELYCNKNAFSHLDITKCNNLRILNCSNNHYLDCNNNLITDLNISNLPIINSVNCYANKLTNFQVNNCPQLECLYFSNNLLINFDFTSLNPEKVTTLHLGNNKFAEQDLSCFSQFAKLVSLSIGDNCFVGSLEPLKKCTKLRVLEFVNNDINGVLEHLPHSIEAICCSTKEETKEEVKEIEQLLRESDNFMLIDNAEGHGKLYIRKEE